MFFWDIASFKGNLTIQIRRQEVFMTSFLEVKIKLLKIYRHTRF